VDTLVKNSSEYKNKELLEADLEELYWDLWKRQFEIKLEILNSNQPLKDKLPEFRLKNQPVSISSVLQSDIEKLSLEIKELKEQLPEKILEREKEKSKKRREEISFYIRQIK